MKIYIDSGSGYVERTDLFLRGRVKFDRAEGEIGHTEAVVDFHDGFTAARGNILKIEKGTEEIYLTVEKMVTNERKNRRVVAKDKLYFIKDKPLPAAVFVNVNLGDILTWVADQGGFADVSITPTGTSNPAIPFYYVEEDTKIGDLIGDIAEAIQGSVFCAVDDVATEGNELRFNPACLKTFNNTSLMSLTADQLGSDEISDLPRQHNQFTLKFKNKKQIPDTLVFRGASYDDTFEVPADGYPEDSEDSYYAEFENPVISITSHSFDGYNCYIDQTTWRSNIDGGTDYGDLLDPFKFKLKFGSDGSSGGTIYDFRIYGNAIKEDQITETLDISGSDYAKIKEYSSELVTSDNDWHKKFIAWVTSKSYEKRSITVVDPEADFTQFISLMYGTGAVMDNRVIDIDGVKMTVASATYDMAKNMWQLEGYKTRTSTTYSGYIEKQQDSNVLDKTQRKLVMAFDVAHPPEGNESATNQLVTFEPEIANYDTEIITIYSGNIPSGQVGHIYISDKSNGSFVLNSFTRAAPQIYDHDPDYFLGEPAESGYDFGNWHSVISYTDDIYVTPENTNPTTEANSTGQTIGDMKLLIRYGGTNYLDSVTFNIASKVSTETVYVVFYWIHQGGLLQRYRYHIAIYDGFTKIFSTERIVGRGYGGLLSLYLAYIEGESCTDNVLEAKYRVKLYQDINLRKSDGISTGLISPRTAFPSTFTINTVTVDDPPYTDTYSIHSSEEWTKAYTRDSSGNILDEKIIAVTGSTMDMIWYRKDPDDGKIYLDYDYNGSRRRVIFNGDSVDNAQMKEKIL